MLGICNQVLLYLQRGAPFNRLILLELRYFHNSKNYTERPGTYINNISYICLGICADQTHPCGYG